MTLITQEDERTRKLSWELLLLRAAGRISLTPSQYEKIDSRYSQLQDILSASTDPLLAGAHIFVQGSMRLKTTINPVPGAPKDLGTIDADAIIWLPNAAHADAMTVMDAIEKRFKEGSRVQAPIKPLRRGIRIEYADENPGFHIDITPARNARGNFERDGKGNLEVPDRDLQDWKPSSPISYADWLNNASEQHITLESQLVKAMNERYSGTLDHATQEPLPTYQEYDKLDPLRATVKLLKRHRDEWAIETGATAHRPISAVITTLATHAYLRVVQESKASPMTPVEAMIKIVQKMRQFIGLNQGEYQVLNPEDRGENFAEKWNKPGEGHKYRLAFDNWHASAEVAIQLGLKSHESEDAFERAMNSTFGIGNALINEVNKELPGTWTMPGRKPGTTRNATLAAGVFFGSASQANSQSSVKPVERLG